MNIGPAGGGGRPPGQIPKPNIPPIIPPNKRRKKRKRPYYQTEGKRRQSASKAVKPLTQAEEAAVRKINNIESGHLKPHDYTGTLRDMTGNPVPKPGGGYWDHAQEMNNSLRGLRKHVKTLENATDPIGVEARERALRLIKQIEELTRGAGI